MIRPRPFLILFPGAWGNRTQELATWWFRHVITHFRDDYQIVVVTYDGTSLDEYVEFALMQLRDVPDGSFALCYSMGAQIARGVAAQRPKLFRRAALFSGLERGGVAISVFLHCLTFMLVPMLRTLMGKPLKLDTALQVKRIFFPPLPRVHARQADAFSQLLRREVYRAHDDRLAQYLLDLCLVPEPAWPMLRLFLPGLRQCFPHFPCPVMAVVPHDDFILPRAKYRGELVQQVDATGGHVFLVNDPNTCIHFNRIYNWFLLP